MGSSKLLDVLHSLLVQLPSLLIIIGCVVAALIRWKRHPKVSLVIMLGLGFLFFHTIIFAFVFVLVPDWLATPGDYATRQTVFSVISVIYHLFLAIAMAVVLAAVFMKRSEPSGRYSEGPGIAA